MNALLKIKTILFLSLGLGSLANAYPQTYGLEGTIIECASVKSPVHKISLKIVDNITPEKPFKFGQEYSSTFHSLYGPRLVGQEYDVITVVEPITTRVIVGVSYYVDLGGNGALTLEDIQYSANLQQWAIGFYGTLSDSTGSEVKLNCQYL